MKMINIAVIIVIGISLSITACSSKEPTTIPTHTQYISKYSADQVIDVVKAQYPVCFKREQTGTNSDGMFTYSTIDTPTQISVQYVGGSKVAWKVTITCPNSYCLGTPSSQVTSLTGYFWESDGGLHQGYIP